MYWHHWFGIGSVLGGTAVGLGAFGAHALKDRLTPEYLQVFETAVRYQMYHAVALLAVAFASTRVDNTVIKLAGFAFILGIFLFSGSLHALLFLEDAPRWLGPITPIGGIFLILGWFLLASAAFF